MPLDQFNAHLVGQKRMFEIGRIVNPRRQHRHRAIGRAVARRGCGKRAVQIDRVILHRLHLDAGEKLGEHLQHGFAVFQHIADTAWGAGVILQHVEFIFARAHQIDADDMGINTTRRRHADHLGQKGIILGDQLDRHAACTQNLLPVVDIVQKGVDRAHALLNPAGQPRPFPPRDDARHQIEGDQPLIGLGLPIDVEGDAGAAKKPLGIGGFLAQIAQILAAKPAVIACIGCARVAAPLVHFIEKEWCVAHGNHFEKLTLSAQSLRARARDSQRPRAPERQSRIFFVQIA